jgi:hypothetical protein
MTPVQHRYGARGSGGSGDADLGLRSEFVYYFFFTGALAAEVFGAVVQERFAAGDGTFLGCLGFFASRLPRS